MFYILEDGTIKLTRGDTARIAVGITDDTGDEQYVIQDNDTLTMTVKKTVRDRDFAFQKVVTGDNKFHVLPSDTCGLSFGKYLYDVQLTTASGDVYTVVGPCTFELLQEVTC